MKTKMIRSRSMENISVVPAEDAKLAAFYLRLTLSDRIDNCATTSESQFQSYLGKHHQFPYHKAVHLAPTAVPRSKPISINSRNRQDQSSSSVPTAIEKRKHYLIVRQRCDSSPAVISSNPDPAPDSSSSALNTEERLGFFQRLVPGFLRRRLTSSEATGSVPSTSPMMPDVITSSESSDPNNNSNNQSLTCCDDANGKLSRSKKGEDHFVRTVAKMDTKKMDNFIFMSMR